MEIQNPCKLCCIKESKYVCPRCNIPYCSLPCYQSQAHSQCSESFYKDCVVEQIKNEQVDPQSQQKMMEILQRVHNIDEQFDDADVADSDDESEGEELASRLSGVNLDDADKVWDRLTEEERLQFEELLRSGDVSEVIPQWQPWWCYREKKKLVEDLGDTSPPDEDSELAAACPPIKQNIQALSKLSKAAPSPCVRWNVVNVLAAYALTARVYNGDHQSAAVEAATTLVSLSDNLASNQLFDGPELAVSAVHLAAVNGNCVVGGVDEGQLKEDVQRLVEGPSETRQSHYVLAALSDTHTLLATAKRKAKEITCSKANGEFSKRFPSSSTSISFTPAAELNKCLKKIEFYLSWVKECF